MANQSAGPRIAIRGARQNNLKNLSLDLPLSRLIVVTGVSGSGKSSLAFDTLYAEGQRRYVETFSAYTRQFLDRMDKPQVDRIDGIPPAIAIDQTNPVRTSRSTVGTMTELNDHLKLLFARASTLFCRGCERPVGRDTPQTVTEALFAAESSAAESGRARVVITFPVRVPDNFTETEITAILAEQGYQSIHAREGATLDVVQDRTTLSAGNRQRVVEAVEAAMQHGHGRVVVWRVSGSDDQGQPERFSSDLHCAHCDIHYRDPVPNLFSFNSPLGACPSCRGFGRVIDIDLNQIIPDQSKTLRTGAIKPWQSASYRECRTDLLKFARLRGIPVTTPWSRLTDEQQRWVIEGEGEWDDGVWYGVRRFFKWLETKSYKMHIRVLLSKYRAYTECTLCCGARLKPDALDFRVNGNTIRDLMLLPIDQCLVFFQQLTVRDDEPTALLLAEIQTRLRYLVDVGLGYLTLDRQSRTLSGGEVQRINLTTALGTSLVNTLFVLDEPSIGLHQRDVQRLIAILTRLRDLGNTIVVVEHDPEVIRAADLVIDMGPRAGEAGGEIVFQGALPDLLASRESLTAAYLTGRRTVAPPGRPPAVGAAGAGAGAGALGPGEAGAGSIGIRGAAEHNLKSIDVDLPLYQLVCLTGVSGSGKSTLMEEVLYYGIRAMTGRPVDTPGRCTAILGISQIDDVVLVDQSSIGKTTRSNPASYVGAFEAIRARFAAEPEAVERGYTAGTFSFNSGNGRCPTCGGNGFEHIEMQFLSDVYVRCSDCDGTRYRPQILEIRLNEERPGFPPSMSIADVLEMTVDRACEFFADDPKVLRGLEPLRAVGLGYLRLGQPVPTLSGGEAQRLKLAGYLAETSGKKSAGRSLLFLFDEPTTGLHFEDIAVLLTAFRRLLEAGHSVVVIEHNLDVIAAGDWIIDLGPEGGDGGGRVEATGPPEVIAVGDGHTARALREYLGDGDAATPTPLTATLAAAEGLVAAEAPPSYRAAPVPAVSHDVIEIRHAREHNLKNIDLKIPLGSFSLITGVSGSGKSTIAFDILFAEGQRRYLESLNAYARQFVQPAARPDVDAVLAVPPTVAIEQRTTRGGYKSTVATVTEVHHFLRLLFVKLGVQYCPQCNVPIQPQTPEAVVSQILSDYPGRSVQILSPLVVSRKGYYTDLARWAAAKGYAHLRVDGELLPTDEWPRLDRFREHTIELPIAEIRITARSERDVAAAVKKALGFGKGVLHLVTDGAAVVFSTRRACPSCGTGFPEPDPRLFSYNSRHGWCPICTGTGLAVPPDAGEEERGDISAVDRLAAPCPECSGTRLNAQARAVRFRDRSITDVAALSVDEAARLVAEMELHGREEAIGRDIVAELRSRLSFLQQVGLGYLPLDRAAPTLSGGEAQRIRLASQLGSNLRGVCYVLDEPTIGLHARDNAMLLDTLTGLQRKGNTVVVVEHDEATIRRAEHVIDLGPGGGVTGGEVLFAGPARAFLKDRRSITAAFLRNPPRHPLVPRPPRTEDRGAIAIQGADLHNLKNVDVAIPLGRFVCVTGVSGSGKSSLIRDVLHRNLSGLLAPGARRKKSAPVLIGCRAIDGDRLISAIREVDQTPIGKTPRSTPATYVGIWDAIRKLFAGLPESRMRGYTASRFSFNTAGGRCESCGGQGLQRIEMSFLPDVSVICESCSGKRFTPDTLEVEFKGKSISDVLEMSIDQAVEFFAAQPSIHRPLQLLCDVGLGYLRLGQQSPTLSGGEAQRIKLVTELAKARTAGEAPRRGSTSDAATPGGALYILDEPTIGLHMADVQRLAEVIHRLVDAGNSVVVIEHNLDLIAEADWIIDLGPEGGAGGGEVVVAGPPEQIAAEPRSHTGRFLAETLRG